jgi:fluoride exporter
MERLLWICVAGAIGSGMRYLIAVWAAQRLGPTFPYGTLIVNLAGCFMIAVLMDVGARFAWTPLLRSALTVGFLGGLTTYSSFNYETTRLAQDGALHSAATNLFVTVIGGLLAGFLGLLFSRGVIVR